VSGGQRPGRHRPGGRTPNPRKGLDQLEGRNVVFAALEASGRVREILVDDHARPTPKLHKLEELARTRGARWLPTPRPQLDKISQTGVHNGVIGFAEPLPKHTLKSALDAAEAAGREPFVVVLDEVQYEHNLGAVLRTASAAEVTALVTPTRRGAAVSSVVQRVAMGGAETVPVVREGLNSALAGLRRRGIRVIGAEADGDLPFWEADFTGAVAIVMGGEDRGLGEKVRGRCDQVVSIPLPGTGPVSSLNVSVAAALLIFERVRQLRG
jgi:23S rRNA (guanosine2251-2'-O)-methyltransferase